MMTTAYIPRATGYASIVLSFISVIICFSVICLSFRKNGRHFYNWRIIQRFIVFGSLCDLVFYASQMIFGLHMAISLEVPSPTKCSIYAFFILYFAFAQSRLSTIIAITAYILIIKKKYVNFGKYDSKLLLVMFTDPMISLVVAALANGMDFNGVYCGLREGKGILWNFLLISSPLTVNLVFIIVMYALIWVQIYKEGKRIKEVIGEQSVTSATLVTVTRNLSFFIVVFVLRFIFPAIHGMWVYIVADPPMIIYQILSFATCAGGIFNGLVYLTVRRNQL